MNRIITTFAALSLLSAGPAFSWGHAYSKSDIKALNESVSALEPINHDLSARLKRMADRVSGETKKEEAAEPAATQTSEEQTLKESANALRSSRPDLAKKLDRFAARESRAGKRGMHERGTPQPGSRNPSGGY